MLSGFIINLPTLECKLHEGKDLCLFGSTIAVSPGPGVMPSAKLSVELFMLVPP